MFYVFNFKNFCFKKPITKFASRIFKFNIKFFITSCSVILLIILFILLFPIFYRKRLKHVYLINYKIKKFIIFLNILFSFCILLASTKYLFDERKNYNNSFITIKVIAYQWRWYYHYVSGLGKHVNYFSNLYTNFNEIFNLSFKNFNYLQEVDNNFIIPVNKNIRLIFTSADVIHSWYIPSLIIKQDAIPGFYRDIFFKSLNTGKYKGFCTELCGKNHSFMPIIIKILSLKNYKKWVLAVLYKKSLILNF